MPALVSPARRVRGPFHATDVRGVPGEAPHDRLARRGRHRRAASVALSGHGCAGHARGSAASSTRSAWASPARRVCGPFYATDVLSAHGGAPQVRLDRRGASPARCVGGPFLPRMCGACAEGRCNFESIGVGVTGAPRQGCAGRARGSAASSTRSAWASPARRATDVRGVRGRAPQVRLDRRGRHRRAASVALSCHGCAGRARGNAASSNRSAWASPARRVGGPFRPRTCGACAGERRKFDSIGVGVTGAPRLWPVLRHGCAGRVRGSAASSTRSAWVSPARRVRDPFRPRMCGACPGKRRNFDSIGVGVTGALRPEHFQATDVRGVRGEALQVRLDRRGRTRRCLRNGRGSAASSTQSAWASPARCVRGIFRSLMCGACLGECCTFDSISVGVTGAWRVRSPFRPRMRGACAGKRRKPDSIGVGVTGAPYL